ncbi:DNA damage-regulated autophagy modulator protein 2-like [Saccostrea echinata]|uniref:DNA damage-regulated autophagy modulator protein 2-like n=1 Tax=Saccostrea echinata TaxID=191078 RepID=UPI002A7FC7F5|nr:DNA damage-regulated autophagy modulator protein 2-like [Saccostrea echinata]
MVCQGLAYLPLITVIVPCVAFISAYVFAVLRKDVNPYFPYISDTGTRIPESCVFGQLLNISSAIAICTIYVRYKLIQSMIQLGDESILRYNKHALVWGALASLGLSLVANFQETSVEVVHVIGATLVLGCGVIYEFLQTSISYKMYPVCNGRRICRIRLVISVISLLGFIMSAVFGIISRYQGHPKDRLHWKPSDGGFTAHIISSVSEWITALAFLGFFITYVKDFSKMKLDVVARVQVQHLDEPVYDDFSEDSRLIT